jgi:type IV pilus assembly protein PilX
MKSVAIRHTQRGTVLVVSLLLLTVMTILALGASQATRLQERMAGNARDQDVAFQAAEAGLRAGERYIGDPVLTDAPIPCATAGCQLFENGAMTTSVNLTYTDQAYAPRTWWETNLQRYSTTPTISSSSQTGLSASEPLYYVELVDEIPDSLALGAVVPSVAYYRITARGEGGAQNRDGSARAVVAVQSVWARRWTR